MRKNSRIEVELPHLRQVGRELRDFDEHQFERLPVRRRNVAVAAEQAHGARLASSSRTD